MLCCPSRSEREAVQVSDVALQGASRNAVYHNRPLDGQIQKLAIRSSCASERIGAAKSTTSVAGSWNSAAMYGSNARRTFDPIDVAVKLWRVEAFCKS